MLVKSWCYTCSVSGGVRNTNGLIFWQEGKKVGMWGARSLHLHLYISTGSCLSLYTQIPLVLTSFLQWDTGSFKFGGGRGWPERENKSSDLGSNLFSVYRENTNTKHWRGDMNWYYKKLFLIYNFLKILPSLFPHLGFPSLPAPYHQQTQISPNHTHLFTISRPVRLI